MSNNEEFEFNHIIRLAGSDLSGEWYILHALTRVRGVGKRMAHMLCRIAEIPTNIRAGYLTDDEIAKLETMIEDPAKYGVPSYLLNRQKDIIRGGDRHIHGQEIDVVLKDDIDRMKKTRSYKGIRHALGLRVRGQRTRTTGRSAGRSVGVQRRKK